MKKKEFHFSRDHLIIIGSVLFVGFFIYMLSTLQMNGFRFDKPVDFSEGWGVEVDEEACTLRLTRPVTKYMEGKTINFYAYDAYITATVDGDQIYHYGEAVWFCKSPSSFQQFINVPAGSAGKQLTILIDTVYPNKFTTDYDIQLGSLSGITVKLLKEELPDILVNVILLVLGLALIVLFFSQLSRHIVDKGALFLGVISILFVLFSNCDLFFFQLLLPNGVAQYFLYYFIIYMLPLLMIRYLESLSGKIKWRPIFFCHIVLISVLIVLQFTGISEMTESLAVYCVIAGIEMIVVGIMLFRTGIEQKNDLRIAFLVLIATIVINALIYVVDSVKGVSLLLSKLGMCFYLGVAIHNYVLRLVTRLAEARNAEILKRQAYTDHLTGLGNRFAFSERIKEIDVSKLSIVSFDLNNLKYYNDLRGHACGDSLIIKASNILSEVYGEVYRIGGDEFVAVLTDVTDDELERLRKKTCELADRERDSDLVVEIACGYSSGREHDQSYEDILKRADADMYGHKQELKRQSMVKTVR